MAGEESVGRVSVEVVPDADNFGREAEAELERQKIDPKDVRLVPVIDANMAQLSSQVSAIAKALDRTSNIKIDTDFSAVPAIADFIQKIDVPGFVLPVAFDPNDEATLRNALSQIENTFKERFVLDVDASTAIDQANAIRNTLDKIQAEKIRISAEIAIDEAATKARLEESTRRMSTALRVNPQFDFDDSLATQKMARLLAETAEWKESLEKGSAPITVDLNTRVNRASRQVVAASLSFLARTRTVQIDVAKKIGNIASVLSGFDALRENVDLARKSFLGLFTNLPQVAAVTIGIFTLAGALLSSAANMASLAGSAAQAVPILLALPGIAIGVGVMAAALADFSTVLPGVTSQLKSLQPLISGAFWAEAKTGVEALAAAVIGPLKTGLEGTATSIGTFIGTLSGGLGAALAGNNGLTLWFANLQASILAFTPAITNLISIFVQFGQAGSAMLVPLAELTASLAARFDLWFASLVAGAGSFQAFADQTVAALSGIIETVIQIGAIFGSIFSAAQQSGAITFEGLAQKLKGFADTMNEVGNHQTLVNLFIAAREMWDNFIASAGGSIGEAVGNIAVLLQAVLPVVGTITGTLSKLFANLITPEVAFGIKQFVDGISAGIEAMKPAFAPVSSLLASLGPVLGTLATVIGNVFGALAPSITGIVSALGPLITKLGGGLLDIIVKLQDPIQLLATALVDALGNPALMAIIDIIVNSLVALIPALTPIIGLAASLVSALLPLIVTIFQPIAGLISQIVPLFTPLAAIFTQIVNAVSPLIPIFVNLITAALEPILPLIVTLASSLLPILVPIIQILATVLQAVMLVLQPIIEFGLPLLSGLLTGLIAIIGNVITMVAGFVQGALTWIQDGITAVSDGISAFGDKWREIWQGVFDFFKGIWEGLLAWVKNLLGINSPSTWFLDLAKNMFLGMLNGLKAAWKFIQDFFTAIWTWLKDTFIAAFNTYKDIVLGAWGAITGFFKDGLKAAVDFVVGGFLKIKKFFTDGLTAIRQKVSEAWTKVKEFFSGGISNIVSLVKALPGKLVSSLGNLTHSLYQKGVDLIQGLLNGIASMAQKIGSWFLSKIPSWIRAPFEAALGIHSPSTVFAEYGKNLMRGLIGGMESQHSRVFRSLDSLAIGISDTRFNLPAITGSAMSSVSQMVSALYSGLGARTFIYNAAPGSSLSSEEDLFSAMGRGRAWGF